MQIQLQRIPACIQDQSLQRLPQSGYESPRPEAADVFSAQQLGHWHCSQPSPHIYLPPQLLLLPWSSFNKVSLPTQPFIPQLLAPLVAKRQINTSVTSRMCSLTSGSPN